VGLVTRLFVVAFFSIEIIFRVLWWQCRCIVVVCVGVKCSSLESL
jgi:hypothetical protein